jgi:hypothetical protein
MTLQKSYQYINEFLYFVIRPDKRRGQGALIYCSGVNIVRFLPITKGRHRPMSNPVMRGLQLVNIGVRALALEKQAIPKAMPGSECAGIAPTEDSWYTESLLIENAQITLPDEIISYGVINLLKKINNAILLGATMPDELLKPDELQEFIVILCRQYGR